MSIQESKLDTIALLLQIESKASLERIKNFIKEESVGYPFSDKHKSVLEKRLKFHQENPEEGVSWEDFKMDLKKGH